MIDRDRNAEVDVWYIGGWKRSGTTLLCEMLGAFENVLAVGELSGIWIALERDRACSCGATARSCPLWQGVSALLFEQYPDLDFTEMAEMGKRVLRTRRTIELLKGASRKNRPVDPEILRFADTMQYLYVCIAQVSGASVLVDSSKLPPLAVLTHGMPRVHLELFHIVRDARAVANSERRSLTKTGDEPFWLPPGNRLIASVLYWAASNLAVWLTGRVLGTYHRVWYEDLSSDPISVVSELSRSTGVPRGSAMMASGHIVTGNPARMGGADRDIRRDDRWKRELSLPDRWLVLLIAWPVLLLLR
ncbi:MULTISPECIES: sulfotransferase [unclassified Dietzia]|uniref:sulfotransferase n=1 Tax=unclassified Dietzia TaxID=2617939 RepID=UPI0012E93A80